MTPSPHKESSSGVRCGILGSSDFRIPRSESKASPKCMSPGGVLKKYGKWVKADSVDNVTRGSHRSSYES